MNIKEQLQNKLTSIKSGLKDLEKFWD